MNTGKKLIIAASLVIIVLFAGLLLRPSVPRLGSPKYFERIMGLNSHPAEIVGFRRDGGMLEVIAFHAFQFPESDEGFFSKPPPDFFERPLPGSWEDNKVFVRWKRTPIDQEHRHFVTQLLSLAKSIGLQKPLASSVSDIASSSNGFYAVSYEDDGSGLSHNVTMLVIDSTARRFYYLDDTNNGFKAEQMHAEVQSEGAPSD